MKKVLTSIMCALGSATMLSMAVVLPPPTAQDGGSTTAHSQAAPISGPSSLA